MNLEEFSEDIQKTCLEEIDKALAILRGPTDLHPDYIDLDRLLKLADILRKWAMLWIDIEKRKPKKEAVDTSPEQVEKSEECEHEWEAYKCEAEPEPYERKCKLCSQRQKKWVKDGHSWYMNSPISTGTLIVG